MSEEKRPIKIAIGGFQHETNTFASKNTTYEDFVEADGWPRLTSPDDLVSDLKGYNIGVAGLLEGAAQLGWEISPLSWRYGGAGGIIAADTYEKISSLLLNELQNTGPIDGLLIDLHGAMVSEELEDWEGEFLRRVRAQVGPDLPIVACLDLHANLTSDMVALTDKLIIYCTYPHVDMVETGRRAAFHMAELLERRQVKRKVFRQVQFLIPMTVGCTDLEPTLGVYAYLEELEQQPGVSHMSFAPSDVPHCGSAIVAYGPDGSKVEAAVDKLYRYIIERESEFRPKLWSAEDAVQHAISYASNLDGPIILPDIQDNYGGGAESDTNWILAELIRLDVRGGGVLCDPEVAAIAHSAGVGAEIEVGLGGRSGLLDHAPLVKKYSVEALGDGNIKSTGIYFAGGMMRLGPMALLRVGSVRVVVSTFAEQAVDQAMFTHLGVEPEKQNILSLKNSVHYRADFESTAAEILEVEAPGPVVADNGKLEFKRLRKGVRVGRVGEGECYGVGIRSQNTRVNLFAQSSKCGNVRPSITIATLCKNL